MANLEETERKLDGVISVKVRWREGGTRAGAKQCETFAQGTSE
jgi:hypothetical protein